MPIATKRTEVTNPAALAEILDILDDHATGVRRVFNVSIDDRNIFRGNAEIPQTKQYLAFKIDPEAGRISYKGVSEPRSDSWREDAAATKRSGKKLNCKNGNIQCGGKCQGAALNCFAGMTPAQKKAAQKATAISQPVPTPAPTKAQPSVVKSTSPKTPKASSPKQTKLQEIKALDAALKAKNFDEAADIADRIYDRAKKRAKNDVDFYDGIRPGNGTVEDYILKELYSMRGYDKKPKQVNEAKIDSDFKAGAMVAYRAIGSTPQRFAMHFQNFKQGDYFAGHGIYGHGTYVAYASKATLTHTRLDFNSDAAESASGYGSGIMRMSFPKSMKIVDQSTHQIQYAHLDRDIAVWERNKNSAQMTKQESAELKRKARRLKQMIGDGEINETSGRLAVIQGYDAMRLNDSYNSSYMNLLNRGKVNVQDTPGTLFDV